MHLKSPLAKLLMATAAFVAFVHPNALAAQSRNSDNCEQHTGFAPKEQFEREIKALL